MKRRIENLEFAPASYLLPKEEWPKHPSWCIQLWYPNSYYGREKEFEKDGDWYYSKDQFHDFRLHKSCFKHPEVCMVIANFDYDDGFYEIHFVGDRPLGLSKEEKEIFWELLEYGNEQLNCNEE